MSDMSSPTEGTRNKGVLIALVIIVLFVIGMAMLGTASAPPDATAPATEAAPAVTE
jgi:hypothetical protein